MQRMLLFLVVCSAVVATAGPITLTSTATPSAYTLTGPGGAMAVYNTVTPPVAWVSGPWISPQTRYSNDDWDDPGEYVFSVQFDLTGLDPSTATISGMWSVDNEGYIRLNGVGTTGISITGIQFTSLHPFTIPAGTAGFLPGLNTLEFVVTNYPPGVNATLNPVGLVVTSLQGSAAEIPEPATFAILGLGLLSLGALRLHRRKS